MLVLFWSGGISLATTTTTHYPDSKISYTINSWFNTELKLTAWTITVTDCEWGETEGCTTITMLDRNLGATEAWTWSCRDYSDRWDAGSCFNWEDNPAYWYHFQWWNNYWFKQCSDSKWCTSFPSWESTTEEEVDARLYWPWNYYIWNVVIIWYI